MSPNAKTMRRCTLSCVSWQRQRELDLRRGPWQVQPHHMRSHTRALRTHTTHAWGHPSTRHAQPKYPCAPCHSRAHTRTRNQPCLRLNIPMHEYIIIITLFYYLLFIIIFLLPRARPNVLIFCGCAPYLRVAHAAGNHSSSAMSPAACCPPRISRCIACHVSRQCEKAFSMRFEFVCTCVRMPSHACSMKRTRCLAPWHGTAR